MISTVSITKHKYRYSPRSGRHRLVLLTFVVLSSVLNVLDILCAVFAMQFSFNYYFCYALMPVILMMTAISLNYYCRLRQYIKGESMLAMTIVLSDFRQKMVAEYQMACKLLLGLALQNIVWCIWLVLLAVNSIDDEYLATPPMLVVKFIGHLCHRIGFICYLWVRYDPLKDADFVHHGNTSSSQVSYQRIEATPI